MKKRDFEEGVFETQKFADRRQPYWEGIQVIKQLGYTPEDFIHESPAFMGHLTLARFLALYEAYKMVLGTAGHIAEVGIYKGGSLLLFAKLAQIFEPNSLTLVHGFDWFKGMAPGAAESKIKPGSYAESYMRLKKLVRCQQLDSIVHIHKLDVTKQLKGFFERNPTLRFKLVFLDAGVYEVVRSSLENFWPRLVPGGLILLDQYNHEVAPGETRAVDEFIQDKPVTLESFPFGWMPTAFIKKGCQGGR